VIEGSNFEVDRILNNILRCSSLVMSDCGLLLELGSFHRRGQYELFIISSSGQVCIWISIMTPFLLDSFYLEQPVCSIDICHEFPLVIMLMHEWFSDVMSPIGPSL
jgi:hypothetical protein